MQFQLIGGASGRPVDVTTRSAARTISTSLSEQHYVASKDQLTWTLGATVTPANPNDFFFYIQNTSALRDLWLSRIQVSAAAAETIILHAVSGTPVGGTVVSPVNRSAGSTRTFAGVVQQGVTLTGLSSSGSFERLHPPTAGRDIIDLVERPIYLPQNTTSAAVALQAVTGAIALDILIDVAIQSWDNEDLI